MLRLTTLHKIIKRYQNRTKAIKLPDLHFSPRLHIAVIKWIKSFVSTHKIPIFGSLFSILFIAFITGAIYRGYFMAASKTVQNTITNQIFNSSASPTPNVPSPTIIFSPTDTTVLGTSTDSNDTGNSIPTATPYPTLAPIDTPEPTPTPTNNNNNSSGNANCTTGSGIPNSWYSDVYPNPPISTTNGSQTLIVYIRDCNKNTAPVSDNLTISLSSGDSSTQINGNNLPYSITTQNGQASFTVTSQNAGTDTFIIQDTTSSFTITDVNNNNPSIIFNGSSSSTPTPTPSDTPTPTPTPAQTPTPTISNSTTPTPTSDQTQTPTITATP